ncbi:MAG: SEL1-like repeat protein [Saprospiraceae bacterium]|nr:SEL1-like repeat protein [Saprospiraceae bacterium]
MMKFINQQFFVALALFISFTDLKAQSDISEHTVLLNKFNNLLTFRDSTVLPDSIKVAVYKHLEKEKMPYDKVFYFNYLCYIFRYDEAVSYEDTLIQKFKDRNFTLTFCKDNFKPKKLNKVYYIRIDYADLDLPMKRGRDFVIFDTKGTIKSRFEHWEGNHDSGDDNHKEEIRDWNGDGDDEVVVNFHDERRFYSAEVEYVFSYNEKTDTLNRIFVFDRVFKGAEEPKYYESSGVEGYQPIDFRDTAYYKFVNSDSIVAHFEYSRTNTLTNYKIVEEEYDFWITRQKDGFYLNPNNTEDFWMRRRNQNEIFYNPYSDGDKQQMPYVTIDYPNYYNWLPKAWREKKYFTTAPKETEKEKSLLESAEKGDVKAQYDLGKMYHIGDGVFQNYKKTIKWYRKAAEQGDKLAQSELGMLYHYGEGIAQDYHEAAKWYKKGAEQGNANAQTNLGLLYQQGQGVIQDYNEALKWYHKAAGQGNAEAEYYLGMMYYQGEGVPENDSIALIWFRKAAEQGIVDAQFKVGSKYFIDKNYTEAFTWFLKAAEQGHYKAQHNLGVLYYEGQGVSKNHKEAANWFLEAAKRGYRYSQHNLAKMYEKGEGVDKDLEQAEYWHERSGLPKN